jgi:hypothetical protein
VTVVKRRLGVTHVQRLERRTAFWLATFTALAGAALGGVGDVVAGVRGTRELTLRLLVTLGLGLLSVVALGTAWRSWHKRDWLLAERGTAYMVDSPAEGWTPEEKTLFLAGARTEMAHVIHVLGPTGLTSWRWPLGAGAERWSDAVDDLVLSFRSVWANDDRATADSLVCWAQFPVAVAWTSRACVADRSLQLAVRQRPTRGRAGRIEVPAWDQGVHTFDTPTADPPAAGTTGDPTRPVRQAHLDIVGEPTPTGDASGERPRILLVRLHDKDWDTVGLDGDAPVDLHVVNSTGRPLGLGPLAEFHEWRRLPDPGPMHPWRDYPALVAQICDWIAATAHPTGPNLIGVLVPQEIGLGIGINVSRRSSGEWPANLWPLVKPSRHVPLTIPGLDLGFDSLHLTHRDGPR